MKKHLLHFLLILVAGQSTAAVADLHEAHQNGQEHLEFNHVDKDMAIDSETSDDEINTVSYDCHHCCHCHGVACHYLDNQTDNDFILAEISLQLTHFTLFYSRTITPYLRPPIV